MTEKIPDFVCVVRKIGCFFAGKGAVRYSDAQSCGLCKAPAGLLSKSRPFRARRPLGETNKHPPRIARVVRLVSLRRLSNFFDSLKRTSAHAGGGPLSLSKKVTGRWPFFSLEILELRERMRYNSEG